MGSVVTETLEHLQDQLSNPVEFFEAVRKDFQEHREDFDGFRSAFEGRGFGTAGEELIKYLDAHGRLEPLAEIADEQPGELAARYEQLREAGTEAQAGETADEDALWRAVIEQFGTAWAAWDGTESGWAEYRDWFYDATNSQDPAMYALAYERLAPLDDADPAERVAHLRELGFDVSGADGDEAPSGEEAATEPTEAERLADYRALADDPAIEGIDHEVLDQLLADPDFESKMAAARATVDAEIEAAVAEDMSDA